MNSVLETIRLETYATDSTFFAFSCPTTNWFKYCTSCPHERELAGDSEEKEYLARRG